MAKDKAVEVLDQIKIKADLSKETLIKVAKTALRTKLEASMADQIAEVTYHEYKISIGIIIMALLFIPLLINFVNFLVFLNPFPPPPHPSLQ